MWSEKDSRESKITPRLRAEDTGLTVTLSGRDRETLSVFESW